MTCTFLCTVDGHRLAVRGVGDGVISSTRILLTIIVVSSVHILEFERVKGTRLVDRNARRRFRRRLSATRAGEG